MDGRKGTSRVEQTSRIKARLMDEAALRRAMMRMAHEILERNRGVEDLALVGVHRRGVPLAEILRDNILRIEGIEIPCGRVDVSHFRDDLIPLATELEETKSVLPFSVEGKRVVLVDDVLYTGRTVRAAIEALFSVGRPQSVQLAILVDRGHRELPIRADYVGKNIPTSRSEFIRVMLPPYDEEMGVLLME